MKIKLLTIASFAMAFQVAQAAPVESAQSANLTVTGSIKPAACNINFTGGGNFDLGTVSPSTLSTDKTTRMPNQSDNVTVTCDSPTKVAISALDQRNDTVPDDLKNYLTFGLGLGNGKKIGYYMLQFQLDDAKYDGKTSTVIKTTDKGTTWLPSVSNDGMSTGGTIWYSWAAQGGRSPTAAAVFTGNLTIMPTINKSSSLDMSNEIKLDGLSKISLIYL